MKCRQCQSPLPPDAPGGHCPRCLLQLALVWSDPPDEFATTAEAGNRDATLLLKAGDRLGRYVILETIGEGGCAVVFRAEQMEPMRRQVALKIIKPGMDTREFIARFDLERQALAVLEHPNIARIFDAGATETGRPYLVMELVRGQKITDYADSHRLDLTRRLALFLQVCFGVHHAHQKGIIHRDLKPSNLLVEEDGASLAGRPRIIDFGIAKSFLRPPGEDPFLTSFQHHLGTPAYMSPEQAGLGGRKVDARTDIYSLGVLLYELLVGALPLEAPSNGKNHREEMLRRVRDDEPPRLAARLGAMNPQALVATAYARRTDAFALKRQLRGDLDCIVMKALEKDPARRYPTVSALISDLENYLQNRPVQARAPGHWYRLQKCVRRNRAAFAVAGALGSLVLLGAAMFEYQAVRADRGECRRRQLREFARDEEAKAAQQKRLLADILKACRPGVAMGRDTTLVREILDQAESRLDRELAGRRDLQADLRLTLAGTYHQLGLYPQMEAVMRKSLRDSLPEADRSIIAREWEQLGEALACEHKLAEAESAGREALVLRRKTDGDTSAEVAASLNNLGLIIRRQGRNREAEQFFRAAIFIEGRLGGKAATNVSHARANLGAALWAEGRLNEAEAEYRKTWLALRERYGEDHPELATTLNNLATVLLDEDRLAEAETFCRQAVALDRKYLGPSHPDLAISLGNLGDILAARKSYAEAEQADRESLAITRKISRLRPDLMRLRLRTLGDDLTNQGKWKEAEALLSEQAQDF